MECIWCRINSVQIAIGHIILEFLGGPEDFVLNKGEECVSCNNGLSDLDAALADSFDFSRFLVGQRGKKGRLPKITGRRNLSGVWQDNEPVIEINLGSRKITTGAGKVLNAPIGRLNDVKGRIEIHGHRARGTLQMSIAHHPKVSRAVHKVALASLVKLISYEHVMESTYDPVLSFVRHGSLSREVLLRDSDNMEYKHVIGPLCFTDGNPWMGIVLYGINFFVDLSPKQVFIPRLKKELRSVYGNNGWTWLPIPSSNTI